MKICVPTETNEGLKARVYAHFGSAPFFTLVDVETKGLETIDNGSQTHAHGQCHPIGSLQGRDVGAVVSGGMGLRALEMFRAAGIKVYRSRPATVEEILGDFASGGLEEISVDDACGHHGGCR
jgi:predicted Fe-Mo cluster-binding NifX family protein